MPIPILVVDDEPNFLQLMTAVLGKRGLDVNAAQNGGEALKSMEKELFDFALVDIELGGASGLCLLKEIKKRQPRIRAIIVTAYPEDVARAQAFEQGASAYLAKPLDLQDLLHTFTSVLSH